MPRCGRSRLLPDAEVLTPDDIMAGRMPRGRDVLIYDDDHYYMGGVLAELLRKHGFAVTLVTPAPLVSILHQGIAGAGNDPEQAA